MELDISNFVKEWDGAWMDFFASAAEFGYGAGQITWRNALEAAEELPLVTDSDQLEELRDYFAEFGAWSRRELREMSPTELNALLIQCIAGDFRESEHYDTFEEYSENAGGHLYPGDDGGWFYYVGI